MNGCTSTSSLVHTVSCDAIKEPASPHSTQVPFVFNLAAQASLQSSKQGAPPCKYGWLADWQRCISSLSSARLLRQRSAGGAAT